jgi:Tfp pilus assembly protein PilF
MLSGSRAIWIIDIARQFNLTVIGDCAHSRGATYRVAARPRRIFQFSNVEGFEHIAERLKTAFPTRRVWPLLRVIRTRPGLQQSFDGPPHAVSKCMKAHWFIPVILVSVMVTSARERLPHSNVLRGAVLNTDGTMVDKFTVVARPVSSHSSGRKPALIPRLRFTNGMFTMDGLGEQEYQVSITAPQYMGERIDVDFSKHRDSTNFRIVVLHRFTNDHNFPGTPLEMRTTGNENIPAGAKASFEKGVEFHKEGRLEDALVAYGTAIRLAPSYVAPITNAGTIYVLLHRPEAGLFYLKRGLELDPDNESILLNVATGLMAREQYKDAAKILEPLANDASDKSVPHLLLAKLYYSQHKYAQAEQMTRRALGDDPRLLDAWQLLLEISMEQRNYVAARECLLQLGLKVNNTDFTRFASEQITQLTTVKDRN